MNASMQEQPKAKADQYVIRFCDEGQRQRLKEQAKTEKRSLNNHLLILIEAGEKMIQQRQGAQA